MANVIAKHGLDVALGLSPQSRTKFINDLTSLMSEAGKKTEQEFAQSLVHAMDAAFAAAGKKSPFNIGEILGVDGLGQQIANQILSGMKSFSTADITAQLKQLEVEQNRLLVQQRMIQKRQSRTSTYDNLVDLPNRAKYGDVSAFSAADIKARGGSATTIANNILDDFLEQQDALMGATKGTDEYYRALLRAAEAARELYKMQAYISEHPTKITDKSLAGLFDAKVLEKTTADTFAELRSNSSMSGIAKLQQVDTTELQEISTRLSEIQAKTVELNSMGVVDQSELASEAKQLHEIEAAYSRILNSKGKVGKQGKYIEAALGFDPATSKDGLATLYKQYMNLPADSPWEVQYQALLKYVRLWEYYKNSDNELWRKRAGQEKYSNLYEQLQPNAENAQNALQNVLNMVNGQEIQIKVNPEVVDPVIPQEVTGGQPEVKVAVEPEVTDPIDTPAEVTGGKGKVSIPVEPVVDGTSGFLSKWGDLSRFKKTAETHSGTSEDSAIAAEAEANARKMATGELERQNKLLLVRTVNGAFDPSRISNRSVDALYDKQGVPNIQSALANGYGGFGDGLYGSIYTAAHDLTSINNDKLSFFEFDISGYNLFINKTVEQAEALKGFLLSLQKFVGSGTLLDTSALTEIADLSNDQLYEQAKLIFKNFSMTKQQFDVWLQNARAESEQIASLFARGSVPSNRHNFATRFMQELGYDGVLNATGDFEYDGRTEGSVIYDPDDKLRKSARQLDPSEVAALEDRARADLKAAEAEREIQRLLEQQKQLQAEINALAKQRTGSTLEEIVEKQQQIDALQKQIAALEGQQGGVSQEELARIQGIAEAEKKARAEAEARAKASQEAAAAAKEEAASMALNAAALEDDLKQSLAEQYELEQNAKRLDLTSQLHSLGTDSSEISTLESNLAKRKEIFGLLQQEGFVTDEIRAKYDSVNAEITEKIALLKQAHASNVQQAATTDSGAVVDKDGARGTTTGVKTSVDTSVEAAQLETVRAKVAEVTAAVNAKTQAFFAEQAAVKRVSASEVTALSEVEKRVTAIRVALQNMSGMKPNVNIATTGIENASAVITEEMVVLQKLIESINLTVNAVNTKTEAFNNEGVVVGKVVGKEISSMMYLEAKVGSVNTKILELLKNLQVAQSTSITLPVTASSGTTSTTQKTSGKTKDSVDAEYQQYLKEERAAIADIESKYRDLGVLREQIENTPQGEYLNQLNSELAILEQQVAALREKWMLSGSSDNSRFDAISDQAYEDAKTERAKKAAKERAEAEKKAQADVLKEGQKQQDAQLKEDRKIARKQAMVDKAGSAATRGSSTYLSAISMDDFDALPKDFQNKVANYKKQVDALAQTQARLSNEPTITTKQQQELIEQTANVNRLTTEINELITTHRQFSGENATVIGKNMLGGTASMQSYQQQLMNTVMQYEHGAVKVKNFDAATKTLHYEVKTGAYQWTAYSASMDGVNGNLVRLQGQTRTTETFLQGTMRKLKEFSQYYTGSMLIYRGISIIQQGIEQIKEIDSALTELKKVTDETEESYENFLDTASKTADKVGSTIKDVVSSTADWARLGYTMKEAAKLAESTQILMNVSEFENVEDATDTLISSIQAFKYTAEESMDVVDIINTIGNNYAISTSDLAESLTKSSGSLVAANGTLEEAVALTATANTIIQDADVVGTALKTVAMRLRGTSVNILEEEGLDTDGAVESISKLQSEIQALSGVDILTDEGSYKSTYQILLEIAEVWENISDIDQAALLELLAGKRAGSVMSAILQNPDTLKNAFESANDASGSATKELEVYLDSIQGRMDKFTNAVQTMWNDFIGSDMVKFFVDLGTVLIKTIDQLDLLGTAFTVIFVGSAIKGKSLLTPFVGLTDIFKSLNTQLAALATRFGMTSVAAKINGATMAAASQATDALTVKTFQQNLATIGLDKANKVALLSQMGLTKAQNSQAISQQILNESTLANAVNSGILTEVQAAQLATTYGLKGAIVDVNVAQMSQALQAANVSRQQRLSIISSLGLTMESKKLAAAQIEQALTSAGVTDANIIQSVTNKVLGKSNITLAGTFKGLLASMLPMLILAGIGLLIFGVVKAIDAAVTSSDELAESLDELNSEISDLESDIESAESELEKLQERMAELLAMPSLSLTEEEELNNLKLQTAELKRQLELQEKLLESSKQERVTTSKSLLNKTWFGAGTGKQDWMINDRGIISHDTWWNNDQMSATEALDQAMSKYAFEKGRLDAYDQLISNWDSNKDIQDIETDYSIAYGSNRDIDTAKDARKQQEEYLAEIENGIASVLSEQYAYIKDNNLTYGDDKLINQYLDQVYAYQYKWENAQGIDSTSSAIKSIFDDTANESVKNLKESLESISKDDVLSDDQKIAKGATLVQNAIDSESAAYIRLSDSMRIVGISAEEVSKYFLQGSKGFNSDTIEGIANQYARAEEVMNSFKTMSDGIFTLDGQQYNWSDFFSTDDEGKVKARADKFGEILTGMDSDTRDTFTNIVESAVNSAEDLSQIDWNHAISKLTFDGIDKTFELLNKEFESFNNEMFEDAADDISGLIDTVSELQAALEDVAGTMDLVHTAQTQMNNSGRISVKTALELMQSTEDWDQILDISTDTIKLKDGAEQHLIQTELNAIKTQLHYAWQLAETRYQTALTAQGELDYAGNADVVMTAESIKAEAIGRVSAVIVALGAAIDELTDGDGNYNVFSAFASTYESATATVVAQSNQLKGSISAYKQEAENAKKQYDAFSQIDTPDEFKANYDYDKTPGDKYDDSDSDSSDAFQEAMDYWENRIGAKQAMYEQVQNEIDLLEQQGKRAGKEFYEEQIKIENQRLDLLKQQKAEAENFLSTFAEGSEEWWNVANQLNDIENEIDDVTDSIQTLRDSIAAIKWDNLTEITDRFSSLHDELSDIRDILQADEMFDDEGGFTEVGATVVASYIQELEMYKNELKTLDSEISDLLAHPYEGNEDYLKETYSIDSEQEYYDLLEEWSKVQREIVAGAEDTAAAIKDIYEQQVDAIESAVDDQISAYNDYIDVLKETLDAERDLYDFKKNVQNQAKDIAETERKIAALSGSDSAADIAERRRLEAQLREQREGLDSTYYDHAHSSRQSALDDEQAQYEETMQRYVETLRDALKEATSELITFNEDGTMEFNAFLEKVTHDVVMNAGIVKDQYAQTGLEISDTLVEPWRKAEAEILRWNKSPDTLALMNSWTQEGGAFALFELQATTQLTAPWGEATNAILGFQSNMTNVMGSIVSAVKSNVSSLTSDLRQVKQAYDDIYTSAQRAASAAAGSSTYTYNGYTADPPTTTASVTLKDLQEFVIQKGYSEGDRARWGQDKEFLSLVNQYSTATGTTVQAAINMLKGASGYAEYDKVLGNSSFVNGRIENYYGTDFYKSVDGYLYKKSALKIGSDGKYYIPKGTAKYKFAKGTLNSPEGWALTDEYGPELTLVPGKNGTLSFMRLGSAVMPADISANLVEWGKMNPADIMGGNIVQPNVANIATNNTQSVMLNIDSLVKCENITDQTLPKLEAMMDKKINELTRQMNYSLKKYR